MSKRTCCWLRPFAFPLPAFRNACDILCGWSCILDWPSRIWHWGEASCFLLVENSWHDPRPALSFTILAGNQAFCLGLHDGFHWLPAIVVTGYLTALWGICCDVYKLQARYYVPGHKSEQPPRFNFGDGGWWVSMVVVMVVAVAESLAIGGACGWS